MTAAAGAGISAALELDGVSVRYGPRRAATGGGVRALSDVTLSVNAGERVAVVGRSGAGKSTIARLACGLTAATSGCVRTLGVDLNTAGKAEVRALRRRMHLVFQDPYQSLHPGLPLDQLVREPLAIAGVGSGVRPPIVAEALTSVGLQQSDQFLRRRPTSLSGGQRQRVAIARALVAAPDLILADEPTSMLDASLRATIADLLLALQADRAAALIFITHDLALARHVSDRIIVMADGSVVEDRPTEELLADPDHPETRTLLAAARYTGRRSAE
ncbi:MAG: ATP-binding cassette domain-containing protein [Actinomycetota bacterium]